ncbi:DUF3973 domain-containing protein [Bacillus sp. 3255]|uniref:DUF3973 domain-containing protein n=1 Tax=Bacillus sp. 3255 TaxID=2817904 RepID=UPI00285E486D|nr:hypothetical protein [Bacillus sp. 3255]
MNCYFCVQCKQIHINNYSDQEMIFKSGFHYVNSNLYYAGFCNNQITFSVHIIQEQLRSNSFHSG